MYPSHRRRSFHDFDVLNPQFRGQPRSQSETPPIIIEPIIIEGEKNPLVPETKPDVKIDEKKSGKMKKWPSNPRAIVPYDRLVKPIKEILEQGYRLIRRPNITNFIYQGYNIGKPEQVFYQNPKQRLTSEAVCKATQKGESLFDTMLNVMFLLGIEQGRRVSHIDLQRTRDLSHSLQDQQRTSNDLRRKIDALETELALLKDDPFISPEELKQRVDQAVQAQKLTRLERLKEDLAKGTRSNIFHLPSHEKTKFSDLISLANSLPKEICTENQWAAILKDHGWTMGQWKKQCRKKKTTALHS